MGRNSPPPQKKEGEICGYKKNDNHDTELEPKAMT